MNLNAGLSIFRVDPGFLPSFEPWELFNWERQWKFPEASPGDSLKILTQPQAQTVEKGDTLTIEVQANHVDGVSYEWRQDGSRLHNNSSVLRIENVDMAMAGSYEVTLRHKGQTIVSKAVTISVGTEINQEMDKLLSLSLDGQVNDSSVYNQVTTASNLPFGKDRHGISEGAAFFDNTSAGGSARISVEDAPSLKSDRFTISLWVNPKTFGYSSHQTWSVLMRKGTATRYSLFIDKNTGQPFGQIYDNSAGTGGKAFSLDFLKANQWSHLVSTYVPLNGGTLRFYVDGVFMEEATEVGGLPSNGSPISIGSGSFSGISSSFEGWLDDLAIYGDAMNDAMIKALYDRQK